MDPASSNPVDDYARRVRDGVVPAGKYHRLACVRHLEDRNREGEPGFPYEFIWEEHGPDGKLVQCAQRFLEFCRKLKHYKGRQFAGMPFQPTENQVFRLGSIFGWRHVDTGLRRFTTAYNELPRKTGKSFEAAAVGIYATFFEGEDGAEGYCLATKEQQARIVFDAMKRLTKSSGLTSLIKINAKNLNREITAQKLEPIGSDSDTTDGLNPHLIITDEFHAIKVRSLIDVMESATGARINPLHFQITTAGNDPVSPCGDQHDYACRILDGTLEDDPSTLSFFAFIAHADPEDDPWDEKTWIKANPHWNISVNPEDMHKLAAKAKQMPSAAAEFKQKRLNLWVNASAPCLSVEGWKRGQTPSAPGLLLPELRGLPCYVGIDLASKIDLCAVSLVFPPTEDRPKWRWVQRIWTPGDTLVDRSLRDRAPYPVWRDQGWLLASPGVRIVQQLLIDDLVEASRYYDFQLIGYDEWHADKFVEDLTEALGAPDGQILAVSQTYRGMSSACLRVQADILAGEIDAGGCPVTAWAVSNAVPNTDGKDNLMFAKGKSRGRIDPVIAGTIATALYLKEPPVEEQTPSLEFFGAHR